jgi:cell division septum initiation protein DivIVA
MSDQSGLSIFDAAEKSGDASFPLARRGGYDSDAVDAWVRTQSAEFQRAAESLKAAQSENDNLRELIEKLKERVEAVEKPSYSGLGNHAAQLLGLAEQEADDVRNRASREAEELLAKAKEEAAIVRATANHEAEELRGRAVAELEEKRTQLMEDAEAMHADALAHAEDLRAQAEREAAQLRLAAEQDAQNMRLGATREVEQARAAADREVTEARRVLAVEKERLAREASENHASAMEQTSKLVRDAETRAKAADDRARDVMAQAAKARDAASAEAARLLENAKGQAAQLVSGAGAEAQHIKVSATTDAERQTRLLRVEVEELQRKRDGIMTQMGQLRDIVATFAPTAIAEAESGADEADADDAAESDTKADEKAKQPAPSRGDGAPAKVQGDKLADAADASTDGADEDKTS